MNEAGTAAEPTNGLGTPGAAAPRIAPRALLAAACLCLLAATVFHSTLLFGGSLQGRDWASHHYHYFDWVRISLTEFRTLPLYMADAWVTPNFLANAESPSLGPLAWLLFVLPTGVYVKLLVVLFCGAGLLGMFLLLRDLGAGLEASILAAVVFAGNGFFVSHIAVGHHWVLGGYLLPILFWLYRRAALGSFAALWAAAATNAFTIGGGQHQPFIWQNMALAMFAVLWAIRARALFPLTRLGLVLAATLGLGAVKLLPMITEFAGYDPTARIPGLPPALLLASLAGSDQGPGLVAPGLRYEHGAGWWEYAFYVGPLALAALTVGVVVARRRWPLLLIGGFFLLLALHWTGPLRWLRLWELVQALPVWTSQRCPSRFLFLTLFAFIVVGSLGLDRLLAGARSRWPRSAPAVAALLVVLVGLDLGLESRAWQSSAVGRPIATRDHRPHPLRITAPGNGVAELLEFAPNRLVYRVEANGPGRFVFPVRFGRRAARRAEWSTGDFPAVSERGRLALDLPPGGRDVVMTYRPPGFRAGAALSTATLVVLGASIVWRRRSSRAGSSRD